LTETEMKAGGWDKVEPMLIWTVNQTGLTRINVKNRDTNYPLWEKIMRRTPILNRFLKVSSYGAQEELREITETIQRLESKKILKKSDAIKKYTKIWNNSKIKDWDKISGDLLSAVYGGQTIPTIKISSLMDSFVKNIIKTDRNPYVNSLIFTTSTKEQIAIIKKLKETLSAQELNDIGTIITKNKIVSIDTWNKVIEER